MSETDDQENGRIGLSAPEPRRKLHERQVIAEGFQREDGNFDIEGRLTDTKTYAFDNAYRGTIAPGDWVHRMALRMTVDRGFRIQRVEAAMADHPFGVCPEITAAFRRLEGLAIRPGFTRQVRERVGGVNGCTHLVNLVEQLAVVAFQTIGPLLKDDPDYVPRGKPRHLDSCHALRTDGPVVREHYPQWYRRPGEAARSDESHERE